VEIGDFAHWSPDTKSFVYHSPEGLKVSNLSTGIETLAASNALDNAEAFYAAWSPDGAKIYYTTRSAQGSTIRSVSAGGGRSTVLVDFDDPARQHTQYGFCTDGKLCYSTVGSPESDIFVADLGRP
jgi:Tol biopolymer transport system component